MELTNQTQQVYDEITSTTAQRSPWYIQSNEERLELLLVKMMRFVAKKCPDDDHDYVIRKLRLNQEEIDQIKNNEALSREDKLLKLFSSWRLSKQWNATEAQQKFIHLIDLVDLPKVVTRLKSFQVYAKAIAL